MPPKCWESFLLFSISNHIGSSFPFGKDPIDGALDLVRNHRNSAQTWMCLQSGGWERVRVGPDLSPCGTAAPQPSLSAPCPQEL